MFPRVVNGAMRVPVGAMLGIGLCLFGTGCVPPVTQVDLSAIPTAAPFKELASAQIRSIPIPKEKSFPRALDVLLDMGFQVRCASQETGQINAFKAWKDPSGSTLSLEATFLLRAGDSGSTVLRMSAVGTWKFISSGGTKSADADVSGIVATEDPEGYRQFLDRLVAGICPTANAVIPEPT